MNSKQQSLKGTDEMKNCRVFQQAKENKTATSHEQVQAITMDLRYQKL
jgi:hypothetical protein